jgi:class 3 adenylate cyclase
MEAPHVKRRLTCILAADAVSYSRLASEDEEGTLRVLAAHRAVIDGVIAFHDGRIISTAGDSVVAEFPSAVEAVRCAVEIQSALRTRNDSLPEGRRLHFRVGVNVGDVVVKDGDLLGDGVNVAARLEGIAEPGGIVISSSVYDQITGKLDLGFEDIGEQHLKNIIHPVRAFRLTDQGRTVRATPVRAWRRPLLWAGALLATATIAAVVLVRMPWGSASPSNAAPATIAADPEKSRLERELAEATKARAEAEARAKLAETEAHRARAEKEAAQSSEKAQRVVAQRAKPPAETPPRNVAPDTGRERVAPRANALEPAAYDGRWIGLLSCEQYEDVPAGSQKVPFKVAGGLFVVEWGVSGRPGFGRVEGRPAADGSLVLVGTAVARTSRQFGKPLGVRFEGKATGQGFDLRGRIGRERACTLSLSRAE